MESVGELLRQEREAQQKSIDDVSKTTRISSRVIEALEGDRHSMLSAPVYVKGFLRTYARHLGLDEEEIIRKYLRFTEQTQEPDELDDWGEIEMEVHRSGRGLSGRWLWIGVGVVVAVAAVLYFARGGIPGSDATRPGGAYDQTLADTTVGRSPGQLAIDPDVSYTTRDDAGEAASESNGNAGGDASVDRSGVEAPNPQAGVVATREPDEPMIEWHRLELMAVALERTWLRVSVDGVPSDDITLERGERRTWQADEYFELDVGSGIGIRLYLDGEELGLAGSDRRVVEDLIVDANGMSH